MVVCVVSAFYPIPSKFPVEQYLQWMEQFFLQTPFHLVLFTDQELLPIFSKWRAQWRDRTILVGLPFTEFSALRKWGSDPWIQAKQEDHETNHSPELYCMWYEKKEFVLRAIAMNAFGAEKFVWCDSGILRYPDWISRIQRFPLEEKIVGGKMNLLQIVQFEKGDTAESNFRFVNRVGGGIQAADKETWIWWSEQYDVMMKKYIASGRFIGKDQSIMASLCLQYSEKVHLIESPSSYDGIAKWFWLLLYFSN